MDGDKKLLIEYFQTKEDLTRLKLMLIKIAAMLNEDKKYSKNDAFEDILNMIEVIEENDVPMKIVRKK
jgi:GTP-binding protein EngB required for normal cell division